ncbi:hypothetical protein PHYBOEH_008075 [Phytophthora boehmeriae]|uniref:Uncharacterized protein n=1 Tax=Phytophthora boehmeriae TaxID=109152 RepID=A0A8T1X2D3_9STRA|nr:hypothetical protein PHYBOEH_008075 [Phytophthora boehmeriae]
MLLLLCCRSGCPGRDGLPRVEGSASSGMSSSAFSFGQKTWILERNRMMLYGRGWQICSWAETLESAGFRHTMGYAQQTQRAFEMLRDGRCVFEMAWSVGKEWIFHHLERHGIWQLAAKMARGKILHPEEAQDLLALLRKH